MIKITKLLSCFALVTLLSSQSQASMLVDGFENGVPSGSDVNGIDLGFTIFQGSGSTASVSIATGNGLTAPLFPGKSGTNKLLKLDLDVTSFAGVLYRFANSADDAWVSQDWSGQRSISFWLYGNGTGAGLFLDILENRNPGSTVDDAERFVYEFADTFNGWQLIDIPFEQFVRKEIGNGAPDDGLALEEVYGWAFGALNTSTTPLTLFIDDLTAVPTPATLALILIGFAGFGLRRKIRQ